jgi:hypothetical protein
MIRIPELDPRHNRGEMYVNSKMLSYVSIAAAALAGVGLGAWLFAGPPARALEDTAHIITGATGVGGGTSFLAPSGTSFGATESKAQTPLPAGTLSKLRVKLTTDNVPSAGDLTVMIRVNGVDTNVTCTLAASGICTSGNKAKALNNNALVTLRITNNLTDAGGTAVSYSMQLD